MAEVRKSLEGAPTGERPSVLSPEVRAEGRDLRRDRADQRRRLALVVACTPAAIILALGILGAASGRLSSSRAAVLVALVGLALLGTRTLWALSSEERLATLRELDHMADELRRAQDGLLRSEKMASLGTLVSGIAHEINTPLGALQSNADVSQRAWVILKEVLEDKDLAEAFSKHPRLSRALATLEQTQRLIPEATGRIVRIVRELRTYARLDQAEIETVDVREGIESTLTLLHHELKNRIRVVKEYEDIPLLSCHPNQINQVFMNLLTNAAHAIQGSGTITIRTRADGSSVLISFQDTGSGIGPENMKRLFEPGFTTKDAGLGTGLGLSISRRIAQDHKGTIEVESEVGKGSTFTLRLPLVTRL